MSGRAVPTLWALTCPDAPFPASPLAGDVTADVAVVGAGYTGLWTAHALLTADPRLRVVVVDRRGVGFGASGRNGGWCSALLPVGLPALERRHGHDATVAWQRAMIDTVDLIGAFSAESAAVGDDPQFRKGGTVVLARNGAQRARITAEVETARRFGLTAADVRLLDAAEAREHIGAESLGATFTPHCGALHPLRLVHAVAAAATRSGARIATGVDVTEIGPGRLTTTAGTIRAEVVVLATEAYTARLPRRRRRVLPVYSLMIGSEPLSATQWEAIGLADRQTFAAASHLVVYGQRTADGRLAFGGRGAPYHFGSRVEDRFDTDERVRSALRDTLTTMLPGLADVDFPHHWGGALAAPRDWHPHVVYDRDTGIASAGGYVGDGVAASHLAGRTLADLICGRDTDLTRLPWVGHRSRAWEPEPLRWLGVRLVATAAARADRAEADDGRLAPQRAVAWSRLTSTLSGRR